MGISTQEAKALLEQGLIPATEGVLAFARGILDNLGGAAENQIESLRANMERLGNTGNDLQVIMGEEMAPAIERLLKALSSNSESISVMAKDLGGLVASIVDFGSESLDVASKIQTAWKKSQLALLEYMDTWYNFLQNAFEAFGWDGFAADAAEALGDIREQIGLVEGDLKRLGNQDIIDKEKAEEAETHLEDVKGALDELVAAEKLRPKTIKEANEAYEAGLKAIEDQEEAVKELLALEQKLGQGGGAKPRSSTPSSPSSGSGGSKPPLAGVGDANASLDELTSTLANLEQQKADLLNQDFITGSQIAQISQIEEEISDLEHTISRLPQQGFFHSEAAPGDELKQQIADVQQLADDYKHGQVSQERYEEAMVQFGLTSDELHLKLGTLAGDYETLDQMVQRNLDGDKEYRKENQLTQQTIDDNAASLEALSNTVGRGVENWNEQSNAVQAAKNKLDQMLETADKAGSEGGIQEAAGAFDDLASAGDKNALVWDEASKSLTSVGTAVGEMADGLTRLGGTDSTVLDNIADSLGNPTIADAAKAIGEGLTQVATGMETLTGTDSAVLDNIAKSLGDPTVGEAAKAVGDGIAQTADGVKSINETGIEAFERIAGAFNAESATAAADFGAGMKETAAGVTAITAAAEGGSGGGGGGPVKELTEAFTPEVATSATEFGTALGAVATNVGEIGPEVDTLKPKIADELPQAFDDAKGKVETAMEGIKTSVTDGVGEIEAELEKVPTAVNAALDSLNSLNDLDLSVLMGKLDGLLRKLREIETAAKDAKAAADELGNADPEGGGDE